MISVAEALKHLFALASPLGTEWVPLGAANGRVLTRDVTAARDQPPFSAAAMDGYAVCEAALGDRFEVIGEAAAGHGFDGNVGPGQAVRIFTGAPVPEGATRVVIQEDTTQSGSSMTITAEPGTASHVRPAGVDFRAGHQLSAPRRLRPSDIALLAAMNVARVPVSRKPDIALISTGDELVMPGDTPGRDQIIVSNTFGLQAMLRDLGANPRMMPIAHDTGASLSAILDLAETADLVITIGGASVGDHDLVASVAADRGLARAFHKVAMRPGKPLMSGRLGQSMLIGLPGNPVSAMVCGHVFVAPVVRAMLGLGTSPASRSSAILDQALAQNGPREHYMRAIVTGDTIRACDQQDSSLLSVLNSANALLVRPPNDPPRAAGEKVDFLPL